MYTYKTKKYMNILITGAAGFIGFHLINKLLNTPYSITGFDNINNYYDTQLKYDRLKQLGIDQTQSFEHQIVKSSKFGNFSFIKSDLTDLQTLNSIFDSQKIDFVVNLAAQAGVRYSLENPNAYIQSNINGFLNILEACRMFKVKHLLYASSSSVYGLNKIFPFSVNHNVDHPISLYAASKKSNELMAHTYSYLFGIPTTGLRFFTVYGPWGRPDMALFKFTKAILNNEPIDVYNFGNMKRDFTYVDDITEGISKLLTHIAEPDTQWNGINPGTATSVAPYRIHNIGNSNPVELMEMIEILQTELGKKAIINFLPLQEGDVEATWADTTSLQQAVNYKPATPLKTGISKFVSWYKNYYQISD